jgi:thiosulfate/3-mercaptopyruvate sulfurtransferase
MPVCGLRRRPPLPLSPPMWLPAAYIAADTDIAPIDKVEKPICSIDEGRRMVIVDRVPLEGSYQKNHAPGARTILFPIAKMTQWDHRETDGESRKDLATLLGPDTHLSFGVYCGFVKCTCSHNRTAWTVQLGYGNVSRHPGGI